MEDGPPIFNQDFTCPDLLFVTTMCSSFKYGAITLFGRPFQTVLLFDHTFDNWALSLSLATTQEISVDFFSSGYLDVSVPRVRSLTPMYSVWSIPCGIGFPIQTSPDQSLLPTPRSFSQAATSFFAFYCQGIHPVRLFT